MAVDQRRLQHLGGGGQGPLAPLPWIRPCNRPTFQLKDRRLGKIFKFLMSYVITPIL